MTRTRDIADDFTREPVPDRATVPAWQIIVVIVGIGITLPIFFLGAELARSVGFKTAVAGFFSGSVPLGLLGAVTGYIGAKTRMSSYLILQFAFGRHGSKLVNALMGIALLGYYAATVDIFGQSLANACHAVFGWTIPGWIFTVIGSTLMTLTAIYGFGAIERLAVWSVPLKVTVLLLAVVLALKAAGWHLPAGHEENSMSGLIYATSAVFGSCIQSSVLMPDLTRFAKSPRSGALTVLGVCVGYPLIFLVAAVCSVAVGNTDIMLIMIGLGIGLPAIVTLIFATWTTNTINIYSTSLTLSVVFARTRPLIVILAASILGTTMALAGIMDHFIPFVTMLGIATPPVGGIYVVDYFFIRKQRYDLKDLSDQPGGRIGWPALISWACASGVGAASEMKWWTLTALPGLDSLLAAGLVYFLLAKIWTVREGGPSEIGPESRLM
jgi:cytosine permease